MKKDYIEEELEIVCEKCGRTFIYPYRGWGKKPKFCINCSPKSRNRDASKERFIDNDVKRVIDRVNNTKIEKSNENAYQEYWRKVIAVLSKLDSCRVELCSLAAELNQYQSSFDKVDQVYLHNLEDINTNNFNEVQRFIEDWKKSRNGRRGVKDIIFFLSPIIESIPVKNVSSAYDCMQKITTGSKPRSYEPNRIKVTNRF